MTIAIFIAVTIFYVYSFTFRMILNNPVNILKYIFKDIRDYFRYRYIPKKPFINVYVGLFGQGKTLSAVHDAIDFYHEYNNKRVYDDRINKWVTQKVMILSNVHLNGVKYRKFHSLDQLVLISKSRHDTDRRRKQRTITIVIGDEFSVQMNSRSFRDNLNPIFLNTLLTSRHCLIHGFYLTSQRFSHMDAMLRQISSNVIQCEKIWRFQKLTYFDAWSYENCSRPADCPVSSVKGFFIQDRDFKSYDTLQVVQNLIKSHQANDFLTEKETRENLQPIGSTTTIIQDKKKKRNRNK